MFVRNILSRLPIILLLLSQILCWAFAAGTAMSDDASIKKMISDKVKGTSKSKMNEYKMQASKQLQSNLVKMVEVLTRNDKKIPVNVRNSAKALLKKLKAGQLTKAISNAMPNLLVNIPQQGNAGQQLGGTLQGLLPYAPQGSVSPLQVLLSYVKENLNGVNTLLLGTLSGAPNLIQGLVGSLIGNLGGLNDTLGGTLDTAGALLGGLLG